jgi:predicted enzyme related to lactoylglutathione lyase
MGAVRRGEINLYVSDLNRSVRFYGEAFGFEVCEKADSWRKLRVGEVVLTLFRSKRSGPVAPVGEVPCMSQDLHVDDIDEAVRRLGQSGATVQPVRDWEGGRFTLFCDPDGISWELISP